MGRRQKPANWFLEIHLVESWSRNTSLIASYFCFTSFSEGIQGLLTNCFQGRKQNPGIQTYLLGIHMYSVRRKKKCRYSIFKTKPLPQKSFYGFSLPGVGMGGGENPRFLTLCVVWPHRIDLSFLGFLRCSDTALQFNWARLFWASLPSYRLFFLPHIFLLPR